MRVAFLVLAACSASPSDDPSDYAVRAGAYQIQLGEPRFVSNLGVPTMASNNNVSIALFAGRLFMAFRTAPMHFASSETKMYVLSSGDDGRSWQQEQVIALGTDAREPRLYELRGRLFFSFFEAGTNPFAFEPKRFWRIERLAQGKWTDKVEAGSAGEIPWNVKTRNGRVWMTSYEGQHYQFDGSGSVAVYFKVSDDGVNFSHVDPSLPVVYEGGVSEVAFEFTAAGDMWAVTRNEDGDASGFGSHVCFAPRDALAHWECSERASPWRYDSPQMFRHGDELYVVARRDPEGPYDEGLDSLPMLERKLRYLLDYSTRRKRSSLYRLNTETRALELVTDLPGVGDTAFPSVWRLSANRFLLANYTSPLDSDPSWIAGQTSSAGTQIYLQELSFLPAQ